MTHLQFVAAAYSATTIILAFTIARIIRDYRKYSRRIAELEAQGIKRRSSDQ